MRAVVTRDAGAFAERVGPFLAERPVEHNVLTTVLEYVRTGVRVEGAPFFAWVEADAVLAAALRTPPRPVLASTMTRDAAEVLMAGLLESPDADVTGVDGPEPAVSYLAEAWRRRAGGKVRPGVSMILYALGRVREPGSRPRGTPRLARPEERERLIQAVGFQRAIDAQQYFFDP